MLKFIMMKIRQIMEQLNVSVFGTTDEDRKDEIIRMVFSAEGIDNFYKENSKKVE